MLTEPFDPTALVDDVDRDALLAYRSELPKPLDRSRAWHVLGTIAAVGSFIALIAFWLWVIGPDGFARASVGELIMYALIAVLYSAIPILTIRGLIRDWPGAGGRRQFRLHRFARANGLEYAPVWSDASALPGILFRHAGAPKLTDVVSGGSTGLLVGDVEYTTGSGKNKKALRWGFASVRLGTRLPHIVLDARGNNSVVGASTLPGDLDPQQRLGLEGDFDRYFTLYCPKGYERDALYLFMPDVMARFIDAAAEFDVEIVDDRLFLYSTRPLATLDPATWLWVQGTLATVMGKVEQWQRWRDGRLGDTRIEDSQIIRPPRGVAREGRRLASKTSWWPFVIGAIAVVVTMVVIVNDVFSLFG